MAQLGSGGLYGHDWTQMPLCFSIKYILEPLSHLQKHWMASYWLCWWGRACGLDPNPAEFTPVSSRLGVPGSFFGFESQNSKAPRDEKGTVWALRPQLSPMGFLVCKSYRGKEPRQGGWGRRGGSGSCCWVLPEENQLTCGHGWQLWVWLTLATIPKVWERVIYNYNV